MTWLQVIVLCGAILFAGYALSGTIADSIRAATNDIEKALDDMKDLLERLEHAVEDLQHSDSKSVFELDPPDPPYDSGRD